MFDDKDFLFIPEHKSDYKYGQDAMEAKRKNEDLEQEHKQDKPDIMTFIISELGCQTILFGITVLIAVVFLGLSEFQRLTIESVRYDLQKQYQVEFKDIRDPYIQSAMADCMAELNDITDVKKQREYIHVDGKVLISDSSPYYLLSCLSNKNYLFYKSGK